MSRPTIGKHQRLNKKGEVRYKPEFLKSIEPECKPSEGVAGQPGDPNRHASGASKAEWQRRRDLWEQCHREATEPDDE